MITTNPTKEHLISIKILIAGFDPSNYEECITALVNKPDSIAYIDDPTDEMFIIAISKDPTMIKYADSPSDDLCKLAVTINPHSIAHIKGRSIPESICMLAVKNDPTTIRYMTDNPYTSVLEAAVDKNAEIINMVDREMIDTLNCYHLYAKAARKDGSVYINYPEYVRNDMKVILNTVACDGIYLEYIPMHLRNVEVCAVAYYSNSDAAAFIPSDMVDDVVKYIDECSTDFHEILAGLGFSDAE